MGVGERIPHQANILFMGVEERESHIKQISCSGGWGRENPTSSKYPVHGGGGERIPHNFITGKYKIKGILQLY